MKLTIFLVYIFQLLLAFVWGLVLNESGLVLSLRVIFVPLISTAITIVLFKKLELL